ncbi:hypothetical protein LWI29_026183 [Acer saccharum]|uniref:Uncharacterized protein n=1 Tax=Acer saccharum TaxID=4024 RepID=A0AA39W017_ACESA|nr:hypothetical protein LWI29_026183 [Acer saccharum]
MGQLAFEKPVEGSRKETEHREAGKQRKEVGEKVHLNRIVKGKKFKRDVNSFLSKNEVDKGHAVKVMIEKGKKVMQRKLKVRPLIPFVCNTALKLGKRKVVISSEEEDSSSCSSLGVWNKFQLEECSKKAPDSVVVGPQIAGLKEGSSQVSGSPKMRNDEKSVLRIEELGPSYNIPILEVSEMEALSNGLSELVPDTMATLNVSPTRQDPHYIEKGLVLEDKEDNSRDLHAVNGEPIQLEVDLGNIMDRTGKKTRESEEGSIQDSRKRRGSKKDGLNKRHSMKTRNNRTGDEGSWNLEVEVANVIERRFCHKKGKLDTERPSFDEEIAHVLKTGAAVGFDFGGKEVYRCEGRCMFSIDVKEDECQLVAIEGRRALPDKTALPKMGFLNDNAVGFKLGAVEKGKGIWFRKLKPKPDRIPATKGGICIGFDRKGQFSQNSSEDISSVGEEPPGREYCNMGVGECSKVYGPPGPMDHGWDKVGPLGLENLKIDFQTGPINNVFEDRESLSASGSSEQNFLEETQKEDERNSQRRDPSKGIDLCIDLRSQVSGTGGKSASAAKKVKARGSELLSRSHPMKTRRSTLKPISGIKKVKWNIENEIAKVIEKGVELGINLKVRKQRISSDCEVVGSEEFWKLGWDLDDEVAKVLEIGAALGFDFKGKESEISQVLSNMEKEDEDRFKS